MNSISTKAKSKLASTFNYYPFKIRESRHSFQDVGLKWLFENAEYAYILKSHPYKAVIVTKKRRIWGDPEPHKEGFDSFQIGIYKGGVGISSISTKRDVPDNEILFKCQNISLFIMVFVVENNAIEYFNPIIYPETFYNCYIRKRDKIHTIETGNQFPCNDRDNLHDFRCRKT